jgi:hypothetical protein
MRFVKGTQATLGFTRFPDTCVLELDGVDADINHGFADALTAQLEMLNIPYTLHWGKVNNVLNPQRVRTMYGDARVDTWLRHRGKTLIGRGAGSVLQRIHGTLRAAPDKGGSDCIGGVGSFPQISADFFADLRGSEKSAVTCALIRGNLRETCLKSWK